MAQKALIRRFIAIISALLAFFFQATAQSPATQSYKAGKIKFDEGSYLQAIENTSQAITLDSGFSDAYYIRGMSYLKLEHYDSAVKDLTSAIEHASIADPANSDYYRNRGIANMNIKEYRAADSDFEEARKLNPSDPELYFQWSRLKFRTTDDKSDAITELNMAINLNPHYAPYYAKRAKYKKFKSDYNFTDRNLLESAIQDITIAINYDSLNYDYYRFRSELFKNIGEPELAIEDYTHMIHLEPDKFEAFTERGILEMQNDEYNNAISDFTSAINNNPVEDKNYRYRGLCRYNSSDYKGAYQDFTSAILLLSRKIDQASDKQLIQRILADTYIKRGVSEIRMGNDFDSCDDFRKAYQLGNSRALNYYQKYCGF